MKKALVLIAVLALVAGTGLSAQQKKTYKIGDKGPGGGTVFYAEGGKYKEYIAFRGDTTWDDAVHLVKTINAGFHDVYKYSNWRLPTGDELILLYKSLKNKKLEDYGFEPIGYWSSEDSKNVAGAKWYVNFKNGYGGSKDPKEKINSCLVRSF